MCRYLAGCVRNMTQAIYHGVVSELERAINCLKSAGLEVSYKRPTPGNIRKREEILTCLADISYKFARSPDFKAATNFPGIQSEINRAIRFLKGELGEKDKYSLKDGLSRAYNLACESAYGVNLPAKNANAQEPADSSLKATCTAREKHYSRE